MKPQEDKPYVPPDLNRQERIDGVTAGPAGPDSTIISGVIPG